MGASHGKLPPCQFGSQKYCGSADLMFLICHVISQDNVIRDPCRASQGNLPPCHV